MVKTSIVRVAEDVLADPRALRQIALDGEFHHPKDLVGWRMPPLRVPGAGARIEKLFGLKITRWHGGRESCTLFLAFDRGKRREQVGIHSDTPVNSITLVVYLNEKAPPGTGTSLWRHRKTGLTSYPTLREARAAGFTGHRDELGDWIDATLWAVDADPRKWQEVVRVENVFNRGVMYRGGLFHSATGHFGDSPRNGRIYALFQFDIAD
jgi:Family of unknown function (DUF6445)